jgi:hypothetical protein
VLAGGAEWCPATGADLVDHSSRLVLGGVGVEVRMRTTKVVVARCGDRRTFRFGYRCRVGMPASI